MPSSLNDSLKARLLVHRDQLSLSKIHAGSKALARLTDASLEDFDDLLAEHARIVAGMGRTTRTSEKQLLNELFLLRPLPEPVANRIVTQTATLEDVIVVLNYRTDLGGEAGRIRGMVQRLAERVTRLPSGGEVRIPARLKHIDQVLGTLSHADFGLAKGSWSSFCSKIRRAVGFVDSDGRRRQRTGNLGHEWRTLVAHIQATAKDGPNEDKINSRLAKLWPLIAFADQRRLPPVEINDGTVEAFLADTISDGKPFAEARNVVYAWEDLQEIISGFPAQKLARLYRPGYARAHKPFNALHEELKTEWAAFKSTHERRSVSTLAQLVVDPGSDANPTTAGRVRLGRANRILGTIKPNRWSGLTSAMVLAAGAALDLGQEATSLAGCLEPAVVERALEQMIERRRLRDPEAPEKSSSLKSLAQNLLTIARLTDMDEQTLAILEELRDDVDPHLLSVEIDRGGKINRVYAESRMGPRHRERLEQFNDSVKLHNWFSMLPVLHTRMAKIIKSGKKPALDEVNDAVAAVLHAITQSCPIRNANLAKMTAFGRDPWLRLPRLAGDRARIVIPTGFVKNRKEISMELTPDAAAVVRDYLQHFRPVLAAAVGAEPDNDYLFPAAGRKHRSGVHLNRVFYSRNWEIGGIALNLHVQRHICGKIILDEDPTQMALVQILLDHKSIRTTESFYSEVNKILALRKFHELVAQRRMVLLDLVDRERPKRPRRQPRPNSVEHILEHGSEP
jgi:hypothetical protein